ncbi:hypothetical protein Lade_2026 [Legionella adelaidensis]|uniref:Uncharacterized protein n=1 Tax=Legionella adelaidensis TaxID=45056 RepID=A0A0W0R0V7_9GAMM|nr:DUF3775 domain-containing protein [Legionella adelaidensis]KTC64732.1 hypothetical protein Lade_2026 [Legionella adelaidensis]
MLNIDSEMIRDILDKARQFQAKEAVSFPEVTDEMDAMYVLADYPDDAVFQDATQVIDNLRPDQQATLIALMLLGRGDFTLKNGHSRYRRLEMRFQNIPQNISYRTHKCQMISKER